jgi:hypothetical protein
MDQINKLKNGLYSILQARGLSTPFEYHSQVSFCHLQTAFLRRSVSADPQEFLNFPEPWLSEIQQSQVGSQCGLLSSHGFNRYAA